MCTIVALYRVHPEYPVVIAANRDEFYGRAAAAPRLLHDTPRAIGGVDLVKGGTWMGANEHGLFVGLTNQRSWAGFDPTLASRGEVVLDALRLRDRGELRAMLEALDPNRYNSFNLIYGDASGLEVAHVHRDAGDVDFHRVPEGVSVLSNDRLDTTDFPKVDRARELATPIVHQPWAHLRTNLRRVLADHESPPPESLAEPPPESVFDRAHLARMQSLCVHTDHYGTRSFTLIALGDGGVAHYEFGNGPPCVTDPREVTPLLAS